MAHEDSSGWQNYARRQADRLEAAMLADQTLEEQRDALVASFYEDYSEPVDIEAEFRSLVASFEADHGDELAQHKARYVVAEAPQHHGRGTLVASYVTDALPDDLDGLLAALHQRDMEPGGLVAAVAAREAVGPPEVDQRADRLAAEARARQVAERSAQTSLVASVGSGRPGSSAPIVYTANHPVSWARRRDRLHTLLARGGPSGSGSSSAPRASSITASAATADLPDGTVLTWHGLDRKVKRIDRLIELLERPEVPS